MQVRDFMGNDGGAEARFGEFAAEELKGLARGCGGRLTEVPIQLGGEGDVIALGGRTGQPFRRRTVFHDENSSQVGNRSTPGEETDLGASRAARR